MTTLHAAAARGFARDAAAYERGRPDYPPALDAWLASAVGLCPGATVVDLGAGTGKFVPRLTATGASVIAIEPVDAMRDALVGRFPDVDTRAGVAAALPLADASVDAVVCAQSFHWFATADAMREIARVVRPGGALALVWNVRDASVPWVARLTDLFAPFEGDAPRYASGAWRDVFPAAGFGPLEETCLPHVHVGPPDDVIVARCLSVSFVAALPDVARRAFARRLDDLIDGEPTLRGRREVAFPYVTVAYHARRLA